MGNQKISGSLFKKMVTNGAVNLKNNHKEIDHLNVFPVPDGDTGTNMQMTMMSGVKEVKNLESKSIVDISKILSKGLLMGARGNSGVILSQFFRGVYSEISKIGNGSASKKEFIQALVSGYQMAYRAVVEPVEGTILTVVRESAERVVHDEAKLESIEDVLKTYLDQAKSTLQKTPDLLPVLKEAGVVDSGGAGFIKIIEGMLLALEGVTLEETEVSETPDAIQALGNVDIEFAYCTEFIVKLFKPDEFSEDFMKEPLSKMGDSLVVVADEELLKIHVHTNQPGVALTLAQKYGDLQTIKIENMRLQHSAILDASVVKKEKSKYGIIAVCSGAGIKETFRELGVDYIIDGGQTMNPPTEEFIKAVEEVNAEKVIILPNNSNVILSAEQAVNLVENVEVRVLRTKTIAQGYSSLIAFDEDKGIDDNVEEMTGMFENVISGEVTYSIRDTEMNGGSIKAGDFIGIKGKEIVVSKKSRSETTKDLLKSMINEESGIATIFYGKEVSQKEIKDIENFIKKTYPELEVEAIEGKQEIYSYIIAVE